MSSGLSWREHLILARIEDELRLDRELDLALRTMRIARDRSALWRPVRLFARVPTGLAVLLVAFALGLTTVVVQVRTQAAYTLLAVVWALTLLFWAAKFATRRRGPTGDASHHQEDKGRT
jgi:hypothetical protein